MQIQEKEEQINILSDGKLANDLKQGLEEIRQGKVLVFDENKNLVPIMDRLKQLEEKLEEKEKEELESVLKFGEIIKEKDNQIQEKEKEIKGWEEAQKILSDTTRVGLLIQQRNKDITKLEEQLQSSIPIKKHKEEMSELAKQHVHIDFFRDFKEKSIPKEYVNDIVKELENIYEACNDKRVQQIQYKIGDLGKKIKGVL